MKLKRGFAVMDKEMQRQIARSGGIASHKKGVAHRFTSEEGKAAAAKRKSYPGGKGRALIQDEFTNLPISRQMKWRLRNKAKANLRERISYYQRKQPKTPADKQILKQLLKQNK